MMHSWFRALPPLLLLLLLLPVRSLSLGEAAEAGAVNGTCPSSGNVLPLVNAYASLTDRYLSDILRYKVRGGV